MGMELIRRASVAELEAYRNKALNLFAEAFDLLAEARNIARMAAPSVSGVGRLDDQEREALAPRYAGFHEKERRGKFLNAVTKGLDAAVWTHLIGSTDLEKLMDKKARDKFREQLRNDPPPATAENCLATMQSLIGDADMIFRRGIAEVFSNLDRRFRTHDGFKIGSRIVLNRAFGEHGWWNHYLNHDDSLRDVERVFCVLDGKAHPDRMGGIIGNIEQARPRNGCAAAYLVENDYFRIRIFKNGNMHVYFLRDDLLRKVNLLLADHYGGALGCGPDAAEPATVFNRSMAKNYGFIETPHGLATRVISEAGDMAELTVLEPSAGKGRLAAKAAAKGAKVTCIEVQSENVAVLLGQGVYERVIGDDFFDTSPEVLGTFDRIIMNPPFDNLRDIDHVLHALKFLKPGGKLVAIMSAGVEFRETAKAAAFRAMVERMEGDWVDLPAGSFAESGTMVNTVLLKLWKRKH